MTVTTENGKNCATTLSRMNFSGYVRHMTIIVECLGLLLRSVSSMVVVRISFNVRLVSGYAHVFLLLSFRCHCHSPDAGECQKLESQTDRNLSCSRDAHLDMRAVDVSAGQVE